MVSRFGVFVALTICIANVSAGKEWMNILLNKENEHRDDHGVERLKMNSELSALTQKHADKLAKTCGRGHSNKATRIFKGDVPGENIHYQTRTSMDFKNVEDVAPQAADWWYDEIKNYPWPEYKGGYEITKTNVTLLNKFGKARSSSVTV